MAIPSILKSLHGRVFGIGPDGELIVNAETTTGKGDGAQALVEGIAEVTITSAQLLALNATPITLVAAPGAGKAILVRMIALTKPAGTAYAGIAAGEDLAFKYTDDSGAECASRVETTGFLDQTTEEHRVVYAQAAVGGVGQVEPVVNAAIVAHLLTGEIITGDSDLLVRVYFDVLDFPIAP